MKTTLLSIILLLCTAPALPQTYLGQSQDQVLLALTMDKTICSLHRIPTRGTTTYTAKSCTIQDIGLVYQFKKRICIAFTMSYPDKEPIQAIFDSNTKEYPGTEIEAGKWKLTGFPCPKPVEITMWQNPGGGWSVMWKISKIN